MRFKLPIVGETYIEHEYVSGTRWIIRIDSICEKIPEISYTIIASIGGDAGLVGEGLTVGKNYFKSIYRPLTQDEKVELL